jgi:hypothetical protein
MQNPSLRSLTAFLFLFLFFFSSGSAKDITNDRLNQHGVSSTMRRAIQGMTSSGLKKDVIRKNLQAHYPEKDSGDINDIIVLSNADAGRAQPRQKDNKKETKRKINDAQNKFDKWKSRRG